jgi:hypothetical protein
VTAMRRILSKGARGVVPANVYAIACQRPMKVFGSVCERLCAFLCLSLPPLPPSFLSPSPRPGTLDPTRAARAALLKAKQAEIEHLKMVLAEVQRTAADVAAQVRGRGEGREGCRQGT